MELEVIKIAATLILQLAFVSSVNLNGVIVKLLAYHNPPHDVLVRQPDGNYTFVGTSIHLWQWLSLKLNFTLSVTPSVDESLNAKLGIFEATIYKIVNKEFDGMLGALIVTPERFQKMDFCYMSWTEPYTLIVPKAQEESRLFAFIRPFQPMVWLSLAVTLIAFIGLMSWISWIYTNRRNENDRNVTNAKQSVQAKKPVDTIINYVSYYIIYIANIFTNHGMYTPFPQHSFRLLVGALLLAALVLVNSYSSIVVSSLTVPVMTPVINSFEDLASNKRVSLLIRKDIILGQFILNAKTGVLKILGDEIRQHPDRQFLNHPDLYNKLESGPYAYGFVTTSNRDYISKLFQKEGFCRFQLSDPLKISTGFFHPLFSKNFKYTQQLSRGIMEFWEAGMIHYLVTKLTPPKSDKCFAKNVKPKTSVRQVAIKKEDLISAFLILGFGMVLSLLSFFIELFLGKYVFSKPPIVIS